MRDLNDLELKEISGGRTRIVKYGDMNGDGVYDVKYIYVYNNAGELIKFTEKFLW